ncbi:MAG: MATE family efflux transporter [Planctomycetota bacterium]
MKHKVDLTQGPVTTRLLRLAGPMVLGMFSLVAFNLTDTYFVGQLGVDPLAAMNFTFPVVMLVGGVAIGLGVGTASVLSRLFGAKDLRRVRQVTTDGLLLAVLVVLLLSTAGLFTIRPVFRLLGAKEQLLGLIEEYMVVWYVGMVFLVIPMVGNNAIRSSGQTVIPSLIMTLGATINIVMDPILIFGLGGMPAMGLRGAAVATVIARACTMVASLLVLGLRMKMLTRPSIRGIFAAWAEILYVGLPAAGVNILGPVTMGIITRMVAVYGKEAVAAIGPGMRIEMLSGIPMFALITTIVPFVGQNYGAGRVKRIAEGYRAAVRFIAAWGLLFAAVIVWFADDVAVLFSDDPEVVWYITLFLRTVLVASWGTPIAVLSSSLFNGLNRPIEGAALHVFRMFVLFVPAAWVGSQLGGLTGLFIGLAVAHLLSAAGSVAWTSRQLHSLRSPPGAYDSIDLTPPEAMQGLGE